MYLYTCIIWKEKKKHFENNTPGLAVRLSWRMFDSGDLVMALGAKEPVPGFDAYYGHSSIYATPQISEPTPHAREESPG